MAGVRLRTDLSSSVARSSDFCGRVATDTTIRGAATMRMGRSPRRGAPGHRRANLHDQKIPEPEIEVRIELGEQHRGVAAVAVRVVEELAGPVVVDDAVAAIMRRLAGEERVRAE